MTEFTKEQLSNLDISYPGIGIFIELDAIKEMIEVSETHLSQIQDQYRLRSEHLAWSNIDPADPDEMIMEKLHKINQTVNEDIPRFIWNPMIISIWAIWESSVMEISDYICKKERATLSFSDIKGRTFRKRFIKYTERVIDQDILISEHDWTEIEKLNKFRNILVHGNGRIDIYSNEKKEEIKSLVNSTIGVKISGILNNVLVVESQYVRSAFDTIYRSISSLNNVAIIMFNFPQIFNNQ